MQHVQGRVPKFDIVNLEELESPEAKRPSLSEGLQGLLTVADAAFV